MKTWHIFVGGSAIVAVIVLGIWWRRRQLLKAAASAQENTEKTVDTAPVGPQGPAGPSGDVEGNVYDLTDDDIPNLTKQNGTVVILVFAHWCGWCRKMMPEFYKASEAAGVENITWARLDSEACPEATAKLGVKSFPTTLIFRDGSLLHTVPGATDAETLIEQVK